MSIWHCDSLRKGSKKKNVKVWSLTKEGGGVSQNQTLIVKIIFFNIDCVSSYMPNSWRNY